MNTEHTSENISMCTIRQAKKISQVSGAGKDSNSPLYSEATKTKFFWRKKSWFQRHVMWWKSILTKDL